MYTSTFAIALATMAAQVNAFWGTAHLLVARQAESILAAQNPEVLAAALAELAVLPK